MPPRAIRDRQIATSPSLRAVIRAGAKVRAEVSGARAEGGLGCNVTSQVASGHPWSHTTSPLTPQRMRKVRCGVAGLTGCVTARPCVVHANTCSCRRDAQCSVNPWQLSPQMQLLHPQASQAARAPSIPPHRITRWKLRRVGAPINSPTPSPLSLSL